MSSAENGRLAVGQVWRHPNVEPDFVVTKFRRDGRVTLVVAGCERHLLPDYLLANFHQVPQRPTPRDEAQR